MINADLVAVILGRPSSEKRMVREYTLMYMYLREERRKIRTEELHNLHSSSNTIRAIKLRSMSWAEHVTRLRKISRGYGEFDGKRPFRKPRNS